ncbi:uncharacterized protein PHACADRAFT_246860 [Phanerochaete carnosa HHB-10118-sp]|uniref:Uncharacterized protein n=1 Tax=Phanerochaete carnosa (strain HHB-10118-sp) TaxID=650164 RepID=K5XCM7_PHACS|nr:uncharacterized protein PHACADRAFT_246860 [Phanerochaete carnosa HHB-10118-sp]EKM60747.1 hypothetical protein PHACADRAFT_246860 [Phanerochaete carnosa HHB-10118-sp]
MNKLLDAESDCEKATQLNSKYAKAWARLGAIRKNLGQWEPSLDAYNQALELLPDSNLSQADKNIQRECELDIDYVKSKMKQKTTPSPILSADHDLPWDRVLNLEEVVRERGRSGTYSSRWVLLEAAMDYNDGMRAMRMIQKIVTPSGRPGYSGQLGAIRYLVKALITDHRAFRIEDPNGYPRLCNLQADFEAQHDKAIVRAGGAENIMTEVLKMKETESWDVLRPAINTTIRVFIFRAFNEGSVEREYASALETYRMVIELIQRCQELWKDVSREERGEVFDAEFLRGVKCLKLDCYLMAHDSERFPLEGLYKDAQDLLHELDALKDDEKFSPEKDPASYLAFYAYPRSQALTTLGLCYRKKAEALPTSSETYPEDDELHCFYLAFAFDALVKSGSARLTEVLDIAQKIKNTLPKMKVLWEKSAMSSMRDVTITQTLIAEEQLLTMQRSGRLKPTDTVSREFFRR